SCAVTIDCQINGTFLAYRVPTATLIIRSFGMTKPIESVCLYPAKGACHQPGNRMEYRNWTWSHST
ncbi:MAG: hypothetical protein P4L87_19555, partial [Formivibrio sp.]|nr:hypothetical protein [Formivibrio sp.]